MQGAAQRPNAPPRRAAEPVLARALDEPGGDEAVEERERQQAHHREAEDDDEEPGDREEQLPVLAEEAPRCRRGGPERHEDPGEAGDEREAGDETTCAPHADLLARDDGEVAGDEREDARRRERDEPAANASGIFASIRCSSGRRSSI